MPPRFEKTRTLREGETNETRRGETTGTKKSRVKSRRTRYTERARYFFHTSLMKKEEEETYGRIFLAPFTKKENAQ